MRTPTRRQGQLGSVSASHHRQCTQQAQHADACEDASDVGTGAGCCFGSRVGGAGVEDVAVAGGVAELGVEGVDGVGVADGVGTVEGVGVTGGVSVGGFALHEAFWRRVAGVSDPRVVQFPLWVLVGSRRGISESRVSGNFACNSLESVSNYE